MSHSQVFQDIKRQMHIRLKLMKDCVPMKGSSWLQFMQDCLNLTNTKGELLRNTLFSGGVIHASRKKYIESLAYQAADIEKNIILTTNEIVWNSEGFKFYLEVDYQDTTQLPSENDIKEYAITSQSIIKECFPNANSYLAYILQNKPHIKEDNNKQQNLAMGLHIIFEDVATTSEPNLLTASLIDKRIGTLLDRQIWAGATDLQSYKDAGAMLRPAFSRKMKPCPTCELNQVLHGQSKRQGKRQKIMEGIEIPKPFVEQSLTCGDCFGGRILDPNFYELKWILHSNGSFEEVPASFSILEQLMATTLVLPFGTELTPFHPPLDIGTKEDQKPVKMMFFKKDQAKFSHMKAPELLARTHPEGFCFLTQLIQRVVWQASKIEAFASLVVHKVKKLGKGRNTGKALLITLKGTGERFCFLKRSEHKGNSVYFILRPKGLYFQCLNDECKEKLKTEPIELLLTEEEKNQCQTHFGFGGKTNLNGLPVRKDKPFLPSSFSAEIQTTDSLDGILSQINQDDLE
jgi:hypothetical protein